MAESKPETAPDTTFDPDKGPFGIGNGINEFNVNNPTKGAKQARAAASDDDEAESPVSDTNADEAIEAVGKMRSRDRLQHVINNDPRVTVKEAAKRRLAALG